MSSFQPGQSGNSSGRSKGIRDGRHRLRELVEPHAEDLLQPATESAKSGDAGMLRFLLERSIPVPKSESSPMTAELPVDGSLTDQARALPAAAAAGSLSPTVASELLGALGTVAKIVEADELAKRIAALEERMRSLG